MAQGTGGTGTTGKPKLSIDVVDVLPHPNTIPGTKLGFMIEMFKLADLVFIQGFVVTGQPGPLGPTNMISR